MLSMIHMKTNTHAEFDGGFSEASLAAVIAVFVIIVIMITAISVIIIVTVILNKIQELQESEKRRNARGIKIQQRSGRAKQDAYFVRVHTRKMDALNVA